VADLEPHGLSDPQLYEQFVREHEAQFYTYALRMVSNKEDAADLVQDAFLQAYRTFSQVDPAEGGYVKWCYRILRNLCIDFRRRKRPRGAEDEELERAVDHSTLRPEDVYEHRTTQAQIREVILTMREEYREVLLLRYQEGLSYEKIAEVLEISHSAVESRIFRAKKFLQEKLQS